mmetsp:Transcript_4990/g.12518  ORF Transcript_4990/g.12518 Transcript_4990/m.12518 type:complete len:211 (+) Transcript_4990:356-988(+)
MSMCEKVFLQAVQLLRRYRYCTSSSTIIVKKPKSSTSPSQSQHPLRGRRPRWSFASALQRFRRRDRVPACLPDHGACCRDVSRCPAFVKIGVDTGCHGSGASPRPQLVYRSDCTSCRCRGCWRSSALILFSTLGRSAGEPWAGCCSCNTAISKIPAGGSSALQAPILHGPIQRVRLELRGGAWTLAATSGGRPRSSSWPSGRSRDCGSRR